MIVPLLLVVCGPSIAGPVLGPEQAPDGHRSLGAKARLGDILAPFRRPTAEDEEFLRGLVNLEEQIGVLAATTRNLYRARGYLDVLEPRGELTLDAFHRALEEFLAAPEPFLAHDGEEARRWARVLLDTRLRSRARVFSGWRNDVWEVRSGLALLRANTDGWVRFDEEEARLVAARVDLAGALLRARIKDLTALREVPGRPPEASDEDVDRLLAILEGSPGAERKARLDYELRQAEESVDSMRGLLFTVRLREEAGEPIRWRAGLDAKAERLAAESRTWRPDTDEGKDAPREIRTKKKTTRRREAMARAVGSLRLGPFDAQMAYTAGRMSEFVAGTLESLDYFDRFLALRGIRVHDGRNWRDRELAEQETHAIFQIQRFEAELRGEPTPNPEPP